MKKRSAIGAFLLLLVWSGAALASGLECSPEVRKLSFADNVLFGQLLNGISGVGFIDEALYPDVKERRLVDIKVVTCYNNIDTGVEKWVVRHDGKGEATYLVELRPDGQGGTFFSVQKAK